MSLEHTIASVERGDMISSGNGVTTEIVVIVGGSRDQYLLRCNRVSSEVGADTSSGLSVSSPNIHDFPPEPQGLIPLGITSIVTEIN